VDKGQVSDVLEEIALLLEIRGENPFKVRAYQNAARVLQSLDRELGSVVAAGELTELSGIGPALAEKVTTLVETGRLPLHEELRRQVPPGLLDLLRVPGLGPKRVHELHETLGIASLGELEYAVQSGRLETLSGFGPRLEARILAGIAAVKRNAERFLLSDATAAAEAALECVRGIPGIARSSIAGSVRRRRETVGGLDLVLSTDEPARALKACAGLPLVAEVIVLGETKASLRLAGGPQLDVRAVSDLEFPYALRHFTGSKEHNVALRARAQERGLQINEYGLWRGEERVPCRDEAAFFAALGLAEIPPELREDRGEIEAAERNALPALLERRDLRGVLHTHSTYSDGVDTIADMAREARQRGYEYIGLSDHSQSARYAGGMQPPDVERYLEEIDRLNGGLEGIRILKGTECDILPDGRLDYPDALLERFDFVIGSVHSSFGMTEAAMTERVLRALSHPRLDILGHPTGRVLLAREPYALRLEAVLEAAAERGVAVEINANPHRLELDWREIRGFLARGGWVSIQPDAHRVAGLDDMRYGVDVARKGWVTKERVLNALPLEDLQAHLERARGRRRRR
jgi:DNA polymerase (family 10)